MIRSHLGLEVVADDRHVIEEGIGKGLTRLIPLGVVAGLALEAAPRLRALALEFAT